MTVALELWAEQAAPIIEELCGMAGRAEEAICHGRTGYHLLANDFAQMAQRGQAWLVTHDSLIGTLPLLIARCESLSAIFQFAARGEGDPEALAEMVSQFGKDVLMLPQMIEDFTS